MNLTGANHFKQTVELKLNNDNRFAEEWILMNNPI